MPVTVPLVRPTIELGDVLTAAPVRGPTTWVDFAKTANFTLGRGTFPVPIFSPLVTLTNGSEHIFACRTRPRYQAIERKLLLRLRGTTPTTAAVEFPSGAAARSIGVATDRENARTEIFTQALGSQSDAEGEINFAITPNAAGVLVEAVGVWEVARSTLEIGAGNDRGTDPTRLASGQPLMRESLEGGFNSMASTSAIGRRASIHQWAVPYNVGGATSTAFARSIGSPFGTYQSLGSGVPMLARKLTYAATTGTVRWKFLAWVTGGTGDIRVVSSVHGASSAVSITSASPAWSNAIDFAIDCEDPTVADGRRANAWDMVQVEARKNVSGTLFIAAISAWEN